MNLRGIPHDGSRMQIKRERQRQLPLLGGNKCQIRSPHRIGVLNGKFSVQHIGGNRTGVFAGSRAHESSLSPGPQAASPHEAQNPLAGNVSSFSTQISLKTRRTVAPFAGLVKLMDALLKQRILLSVW